MKKQKLAAFLMAAAMMLSLAACGGSSEEAAAPAEPAAPAETETAAALPDISGSIDDMDMVLVGIDTAPYRDDTAIRLWWDVVNNSDYLKDVSGIEGYSLIISQNGEELTGCLTDDLRFEEYYAIEDMYPGTYLRVCEPFIMEDPTAPVDVSIEFDDGTVEFTIDPTAVPGEPADTFVLEPVTDTEWFVTTGDTQTTFDVDYRVSDWEVVPGTHLLTGGEQQDCLRIFYTAVNNGDDTTYLTTPFTPMQDGVELSLATPAEKADTDISGAVEIAPGETVTFSKVFYLWSLDPVFELNLMWGELTGSVLELG